MPKSSISKGKFDGAMGMLPDESRLMGSWNVAKCGQILAEFVVRDDACLGQTIYSFPNLDVDKTVMD
jgi:hypothetical protein